MPDSDPSRRPPAADRNLLFGILALQMDFISREQLIAAMNAWVLEKATPLGELLVAQQALAPKRLALLNNLVDEHLAEHDQDPQKSLVAVRATELVRQQLGQLGDPEVQETLSRFLGHEHTPESPEATHAYQPNQDGSGRFTLLRPFRKGGLGEIHVARDEELNREVALKQIQACYAQHPESRARFLQEAEITGSLEHPGIVPVYGMGSYPDGRPYYAMRLVQGESLKEAIRAFHRTTFTSPGERSLALRKLLGSLLIVCQAVQYAHSRSVLHRDLKPDNILVGKFGETLLIDWGLAKPLQPGLSAEAVGEQPVQPLPSGGGVETVTGLAVGTPAYMSPEQAAGRTDQIGPPTDIYGLGTTLYCLLVGKGPFADGNVIEVLDRVRKGSFSRPRTVDPRIPPGLEAICLKAMALLPARRYPSAQALAQDLEHWLGDEPVSAYPEPLIARLGRWGRRHRALVTGAAVLLLTAVASLTLGLLAVNQERAQTARVNHDLVKEQKRTQAALEAEARRRQQARQALDAMSSEMVGDWLGRQKELTPQQKQFLQKALAYYQEFAQDTGDDEAARAGVAAAHLRVGKIQMQLGQIAQAEEAYRNALRLYASLAEKFPPGAVYRKGLADTRHMLGWLFADYLTRNADAEKEYRQALGVYEQLVREAPTEADYRTGLDSVRNHLARLLYAVGRLEEAEAELRRVPEPSHQTLGLIFMQKGRLAEAEKEFQQALSTEGGDPQVRVFLHAALGVLARRQHHLTEAERQLRQALALYEQLAREYPSVSRHRRGQAYTWNNLGSVCWDAGRLTEAEQAYHQAVAAFEQLVHDFPTASDYHGDLALRHRQLGLFLLWEGRPGEAVKEMRTAVELLRQLWDAHPTPEYAQALGAVQASLAAAQRAAGKLQEALAGYEQARQHLDTALRQQPKMALALQGLAEVRVGRARTVARQGNGAQALAEVGPLENDPPLAYEQAAVYALASAAGPEREAHAQLALKCLRQARQGGPNALHRLAEHLKKDQDFEPLRPHRDFKKLLTELETPPPAAQ